MAHIKPIVVRTISDLAGNNMCISIHCEPCERWNDIDPEAWIEDGLPDVDYVQAVLKCEDCGVTGQKQIRSHDAERESLFMPHLGVRKL